MRMDVEHHGVLWSELRRDLVRFLVKLRDGTVIWKHARRAFVNEELEGRAMSDNGQTICRLTLPGARCATESNACRAVK